MFRVAGAERSAVIHASAIGQFMRQSRGMLYVAASNVLLRQIAVCTSLGLSQNELLLFCSGTVADATRLLIISNSTAPLVCPQLRKALKLLSPYWAANHGCCCSLLESVRLKVMRH